MSTIKKDIKDYLLQKKFNSLCSKGIIKPFDDEFYKKYEGMYYNGVPVYYYLKKMSMNRCYDASSVLALAMGDKCKVCRGELGALTDIDPLDEKFGHGWVEMNGMTYDTTWQIMCPTDVYLKLFDVRNLSITNQPEFFQRCKDISDWTIRDKAYYENNYVPLVMNTVLLIDGIAQLRLKDPSISKKDQAFYKKLLEDLPDREKLYSLYENSLKNLLSSKDSLDIISGNSDGMKN